VADRAGFACQHRGLLRDTHLGTALLADVVLVERLLHLALHLLTFLEIGQLLFDVDHGLHALQPMLVFGILLHDALVLPQAIHQVERLDPARFRL